MGYNEPTSFAYWSEGLHPLFAKTALGHLPHQVRQASHLRKLSHCFYATQLHLPCMHALLTGNCGYVCAG